MKTKNFTLLRTLLVTVLFVSAYSCGTSEDGSEGLGVGGNGGSSSTLGGKYNIISMVSDISVDLNNDGVSSADLLTEVDPTVFNTEIPELEIKPVVVNNQLEEMMSFYLPHSTITATTPTTPGGVKFTKTGLGYIYEFDKDTQAISIHEDSPSNVNGHMVSVVVLANNNLKAVFTKYYYDFSVPGWKLLTITCVYKKM
jgi:hypothetical protein